MTIPTRSGLRYLREEDQEDQQVDPLLLDELVGYLQELVSTLIPRIRQFQEEELRRVTLLQRSPQLQANRRIYQHVLEVPQVVLQAYARIVDDVKSFKRCIDQGDLRLASACSVGIFNCVRRIEQLIENILEISRLVSQIETDTRRHEESV